MYGPQYHGKIVRHSEVSWKSSCALNLNTDIIHGQWNPQSRQEGQLVGNLDQAIGNGLLLSLSPCVSGAGRYPARSPFGFPQMGSAASDSKTQRQILFAAWQ